MDQRIRRESLFDSTSKVDRNTLTFLITIVVKETKKRSNLFNISWCRHFCDCCCLGSCIGMTSCCINAETQVFNFGHKKWHLSDVEAIHQDPFEHIFQKINQSLSGSMHRKFQQTIDFHHPSLFSFEKWRSTTSFQAYNRQPDVLNRRLRTLVPTYDNTNNRLSTWNCLQSHKFNLII